jgi:hypothetical protein
MQERSDEADLVKGLITGVIAGLAAAAVMNLFQRACSRMLLGYEESHGAQSVQKGTPPHGAARMLEEHGAEDASDDSAERLAQTISVGVFDTELTKDQKRKAGTALHYGYGASMGAVYGAAAEYLPAATTGAGIPYGALIWVGADEVAVPALGLSKPATEYPLSIHATALASHLVYGLTLEMARRSLRDLI